MATLIFFGLLLAVPLMVWSVSRRLVPRSSRALAVATIATWVSAAIAFYVYVDFDDIVTLATFAFVVLPCATIPVAAGLTTVILGRLAALIPAAAGALVGWILGLALFMIERAFGASAFDPGHLLAACLLVAPSAIFAASLAVLLGAASCPRS